MTLLLIAIAIWTLVALFACSLGRVARMGDCLEVQRSRARASADGATRSAALIPALGDEEPARRELLAARRALSHAEARLARLEGGARQAGAG